MRRIAPVLVVGMAIALGACSATSPPSPRPAGASATRSASQSSTPTPAGSASQPAGSTRAAASNPAAAIPQGKFRKACLLTVDQAALAMGAGVNEVVAGSGGTGRWDAECDYSTFTAADGARLKASHLTPEQQLAIIAKARGIQILLGCGPDAGLDLAGLNAPIPDSPVPGALADPGLPGSAFAPLSGGCWFRVGIMSGGSDEHAAVLNVLKFAVAGWKG
jgi:hypothetical protein